MNRGKPIPIAAAVAACLGLSSALGIPSNPERYMIHVSVRQGDPHGSREAGTIKILADSSLEARAGKEASYFSGGEVPVDGEFVKLGHRLRVIAVAAGEAIQLKLTLEHSELLESGKETKRLRTDRAVYTKMVEPGKVLKLDWGKPSEKMWVELRVDKADE